MKLFISYRRKSWAFAQRLVEKLSAILNDELFMDLEGVDQADFEKSILGHLRTSHVVLLICTELTFADRIHKDDDWVRKEISEALRLNIPIVLVSVEGQLPPHGLPDDIKDVARSQAVMFYPDYFSPAVDRLVEFLVDKMKIATRKTRTSAQPPDNTDTKAISGRKTLGEALDLLEDGEIDKGIFLLEELLKSGYTSPHVDFLAILNNTRTQRDILQREQRAQFEYEELYELAKRKITEDEGMKAFQKWCDAYPDLIDRLDVAHLRSRVAKKIITPPRKSSLELLPKPFAWIPIPEGKVTLTRSGYLDKDTTFTAPAFEMAKYPCTNAQFKLFMDAGGYTKKRWWTDDGWQAKLDGWDYDDKNYEWKKTGKAWTKPRYWDDSKWNGADYPVVGVSWYEAIAFCLWLSETTGEKITLPTEQQWQRAAQGDKGLMYPWGNEWDGSRCNNSVSPHDSNQTTPVRQFEGKGDSPFGVTDMSGNVWEWCLTAYETGKTDLRGTDVRVLRGGSWYYFNTVNFRAVDRGRSSPNDRNGGGGFRIVCSR